MSVTVTKNAGQTTLTFAITGASSKIDPMIDKWAKQVWNSGYGLLDANSNLVDYATATNNQKFAALNKRIKQLGLDEANSQESKDAHIIIVPTVHDFNGINGG